MSQDWPTFFDPSTCVRKGQCPVTKLRGQSESVESHTLYFGLSTLNFDEEKKKKLKPCSEQHGTGLERVILIMGLNTSSFSWSEQVKHFARTSKYSVVVFDNRGVGNSGVPRGPYTTAGMAEDVIALLDYIDWKEDIHVVGLSLGGMVAQELATRITDRIVSLSLCVTKAGGLSPSNLTPWKGVSGLLRATFSTDVEVKIPIVLDMVFPAPWLDSTDPVNPDKRTNRELQTELYRSRAEIARPQTFLGSVSQMSAAMTHRISADRHRLIASCIPKVLILTGDQDNLINPDNSRILAARMPEAEFIVWTDTGHALHAQWPKRFNELLERTFMDGRERYAARK